MPFVLNTKKEIRLYAMYARERIKLRSISHYRFNGRPVKYFISVIIPFELIFHMDETMTTKHRHDKM